MKSTLAEMLKGIPRINNANTSTMAEWYGSKDEQHILKGKETHKLLSTNQPYSFSK